MANVFEKVVDFLNTPLPGSKRKTKVAPPAAPKPTAKSGSSAKLPPASQQASAADLQAELRKRQAELAAAQKKAADALAKQQIAEAQAKLERTRRDLEKEMAKQAQAHAKTEQWTYTVVPGDTLSGIAKRHYGKAGLWPKVYEANKDKISNPNLIYPGQVLVMPDLD